jgi:dTDP-4-dehydrorhamnose 3,5-epimerase
MLKGIVVRPIKRINDERGFIAEVYREDWKDLFIEDKPCQANFSTSYPATIRAWHRHVRGQIDCFIVLSGTLKICAYDEKTKELDEIISTGRDLQIVRIPGQYWHGFKAVGNKNGRLLYFTSRLFNYENPDEKRRPWNDPKIIPRTINGTKNDPRAGKPWDWNLPPHK